MSKDAKAFLMEVAADKELAQKLAGLSMEQAAALLKEKGYDFTIAELEVAFKAMANMIPDKDLFAAGGFA